MADTKISALTDGTTANSTDQVAIARSGSNFYVTPEYLSTYVGVSGAAVQSCHAGMYISSTASTTITVAGTYYKMAGTTTSTALLRFTMPTNNRLTYTGTRSRHFHIVGQTSISPDAGNNQTLGIQIWHWDDSAGSGSLLTHSIARTIMASADTFQMATHADVALDTNDYIELHVTNETSTNGVTAENMYVFCCAMPG